MKVFNILFYAIIIFCVFYIFISLPRAMEVESEMRKEQSRRVWENYERQLELEGNKPWLK